MSINASLPTDEKLVQEMQEVLFERILLFSIQAKQPISYQRTRVVKEVKLGGDNDARSELNPHDFELEAEYAGR